MRDKLCQVIHSQQENRAWIILANDGLSYSLHSRNRDNEEALEISSYGEILALFLGWFKIVYF